ncbi:hypothetical protein RDI58_012807 [Solanum bulbocastanum]|uniref:Uncharacterized protein n=1 Tax=Solanum bulbocastanum TaxID=147425 RepID=A0AAN8TQF4_SOLBU
MNDQMNSTTISPPSSVLPWWISHLTSSSSNLLPSVGPILAPSEPLLHIHELAHPELGLTRHLYLVQHLDTLISTEKSWKEEDKTGYSTTRRQVEAEPAGATTSVKEDQKKEGENGGNGSKI